MPEDLFTIQSDGGRYRAIVQGTDVGFAFSSANEAISEALSRCRLLLTPEDRDTPDPVDAAALEDEIHNARAEKADAEAANEEIKRKLWSVDISAWLLDHHWSIGETEEQSRRQDFHSLLDGGWIHKYDSEDEDEQYGKMEDVVAVLEYLRSEALVCCDISELVED